jgi:hypothetical protein
MNLKTAWYLSKVLERSPKSWRHVLPEQEGSRSYRYFGTTALEAVVSRQNFD